MCKLMEDYTERKSRIAREEGEQKGKEEGIQKGKIEGERSGALKANEKTARKMIADGMPFDMIAKYSGLTVEQVENLAKENK